MVAHERDLQRLCIKAAKSKGVLAINIHGGGWGNKGFPDLLLIKNGKVIACELKIGDKYKQQPAQKIWQDRFERAGTKCALVYTLAEFEELLKGI